MPEVTRLAITGAPGGGKSSLLKEMAERGFVVSPEVARIILQAPGGMSLRDSDPAAFAQRMLEAEMQAFEAAPISRTTIFDRGFPDIVGFLRLEGLPVFPELDLACRSFRYHRKVYRARAWREIYRQDAERTQDWNGALASDEAVTDAWRRYGYEIVDLPLASVDERADFLAGAL